MDKDKLLEDLANMAILFREQQMQYEGVQEEITKYYYLEGAIVAIDSVKQAIKDGTYDSKLILPNRRL